ncbi:hypothetical protein [Pseudomonas fluorescens]|uniref:DUF1566 domain-containing protein n=1 Tax=Pseudomonas fluorescens TaxID=294 RepID=A0A5E7AMQ4_PSEFL|nr:hypothetical protein [Pseudomonas fluorescens]VVN79805.1 hypothetical protein PS691_01003 [Pseudomonas fluorescens]
MRFTILLPSLLTFLFTLSISNIAFAACTAPNGVAGSLDYDDATKTRKICDGTNWKVLEEVDYSTTGARQRLQVADDAGTCTALKTGRLRYNGTATWEYCNGSAWVPFESAGCTGPASCPAVGDVCTDGSVFAGCPSPGYQATFVTRCDAGQTWNGTTCTGTRSTFAWNNGNSTGYTTTNVTGFDGETNTTALVAADSNSGVGGVQPHLAAAYCSSLSIHSQTDWFLPSISEIHMIWVNATAIGFLGTGNFQVSNELDNTDSWYQTIPAGGQRSYTKDTNTRYIRCARR